MIIRAMWERASSGPPFDGTFEGGDKEYGLAQDLPMYTQQEFDKLTPELQETVEKVTQDIKAGTIDVTKDTAD